MSAQLEAQPRGTSASAETDKGVLPVPALALTMSMVRLYLLGGGRHTEAS